MIKSLRTRLFLQVGMIIGLFAIGMVIVNATCLEPYYVWQEKRVLAEQAAYIEQLQLTDYSQAALQLEEIEKTHGVWLLILGPDGSHRYATSFLPEQGTVSDDVRPQEQPPHGEQAAPDGKPPNPRPLPIEIVSEQFLPDGSSYQVQKDSRMNVNYLLYRRSLANGDTLELRVIKNSLQKSVTIANQFLLGVGGVALLLALGWAYSFSRHFTHPILEMNGITRDMSELDFGRKCQVAGQDELAELGRSINHLSDRLHAALGDLQLRNEQLEEDIARERSLDKMRREFVSNVSHELKTPICIILGYAEGLSLNVASDEVQRQGYLDVIVDETRKMDKLVHDLLQLSQFQSGQFPLELEQFDLAKLTRAILGRFEPALWANGITLTELLTGQSMVLADGLRVGQVLTNYLNNALAHVDKAKQIIVSGEEQGDYYRVHVFNSGRHVAVNDLEQIWTSFYKADKSRSRDEGRYGLGLSIVRAIQEMHGSTYGVENVAGGVEFWFDVKRA